MSMTRAEEEQFVKGAFQALIDRGVASKSMLTPSTVTDADIDRFEQTFDVKLPSIFRSYLKAYCYDFTVICAPIPVDGMEYDKPDSWQLCQFDQTAFDWEAAGYIDDQGVVKGEKIMPDFKTLLELYFYGKYDREYEQQLRERGDEMPDYDDYIPQQRKRPA